MATHIRVCEYCLLNIYTNTYIKSNIKFYHEKCYELQIDNEISQFLTYYDKICIEENYTIKCIKIITTKKKYKLTKKVQIQIVSDDPIKSNDSVPNDNIIEIVF